MKSLRVESLLPVLFLLCFAALSRGAEDDPANGPALAFAQQKFAETFVQRGEYVVTKYTRIIPFGHPSDWSLYLYKGVSASASADRLSEIDKMNGITWRGTVRFEAKFERVFLGLEYPNHEKYDGLHPGDWHNGRNMYAVQLEQRNGKWATPPSRIRPDFSKPTDGDLHELDLALQKLGTTTASSAASN